MSSNRKPRKFTSEEDNLIHKMWVEGDSIVSMAIVLCCSNESLKSHLETLDLPNRPQKRWREREFTIDEDNTIISMYNSGEPISKIIKAVKARDENVVNEIKKLGLPLRKTMQKRRKNGVNLATKPF